MKEEFLRAINLTKKVFEDGRLYNYNSDDFIVIVDGNIKISVEIGINRFKIYFGENSNFEHFNYQLLSKKYKRLDDMEILRKKFFSRFTYIEITNNYSISLSEESTRNYQKLNIDVNKYERYPEFILSKSGEFAKVLTCDDFEYEFCRYIELVTKFLDKKEELNDRKEFDIIYYNVRLDYFAVKEISVLDFFPYAEYQDVHINSDKKVISGNMFIEMRYIDYKNDIRYPLIIAAYDDKKKELKSPKIIMDNKKNEVIAYLDELFQKNIYSSITVYDYELYMIIRNYLKGYEVEIEFSSQISQFDYIFDDYEYIINKNGLKY